ncbi:hypothetical protein [Rhizobium halophytocola]|uniref:DUF1127 domain-containing protein n=1 Tax=Rhizobium halophytocola TaxID=735519 RepID=A0ABS4DSC1_9HYPH|nr:hypothetical protein [Rhizobium halophytocola]MBP1848590.1 hypothetical protein [Rhizobium halophytocola]
MIHGLQGFLLSFFRPAGTAACDRHSRQARTRLAELDAHVRRDIGLEEGRARRAHGGGATEEPWYPIEGPPPWL